MSDTLIDRIIAHIQQMLRDYDIPEDTIANDPEIAGTTRELFGATEAEIERLQKRCEALEDRLGAADACLAALSRKEKT